MGNDRYAGVRRLPDAPIAGESYRNAGSHYKVWQYNAAADTAHVENLTSGWVCTAHHPALYRLHILWTILLQFFSFHQNESVFQVTHPN